MGPNDDWYWTGLEPGRLGVRFAWSEYLPYLLNDNALVDHWEEDLRSEVAKATEEALATDNDRLSWNTEIAQVGSAAQESHQIFLWLQEVPKEILTGLLVLGAERTLSAFYGHVKHRIEAIHRKFGDQEITVQMTFHPDALVELCKIHAVEHHGASLTSHTVWSPRTSQKYNDPDYYQDNKDELLIVLGTETGEISYLVDSTSKVLEHRIDHVLQEAPELVPNIPVPSDDSLPVAIPQGFDWPSQDGVDRAEDIAIMAGGSLSRELLQDAVREATQQVLPELDANKFTAENYKVGPAAGTVEDFIVTLFTHRDAMAQAIGAVVDTWAVAEIVIRTKQFLLSRQSSNRHANHHARFFLPAGTLVLLCKEYVRRHYHPRAHLSTEWYCLTHEFYQGYRSPGHPTESLEYLILISTRKETYRFKANGTGEVTAHSLKRGRLDTDLAIPDLFEETGDD